METISRCLMTFLLNAVWQIPLAAGVAALACRAMRRGPAWHRHALCAAALALSLLLPLSAVRFTGAAEESLQLPRPELSQGSALPGPGAAQRPGSQPARTRTVGFAPSTGDALLAAYLLFLAWRLARFAVAFHKSARVAGQAVPPARHHPLDAAWARCERAFHLRKIRLCASSRISGPVTAGAFRPVVILPPEMLAETSEDVLTTAIGHEMAHIARRDFAANIFYELLYLPISFHPAAMWIHREIDRTREMACDELVTARLLEPRAYAQSIMSIAHGVCALPGPGYTLGVFDGNTLEQRIRRLMDGRAGSLKRARAALAAGLAALAACVVLASGLRISALAQSAPSAELRLAAAAFDAGDFKGAADHFRNALAQDPNNLNIRLHLANAEMRENAARPDGPRDKSPLLADARQQYLEVLARDNANRHALERLTWIDVNTGRLEEARTLAFRGIQAGPASKNAYYLVGFVDWSTAYHAIDQARRAAGEPVQEPQLQDAAARKALRGQYLARIEEGFGMMRNALRIDGSYADAMAYCNLLLRAKAAIVDDPAEVRSLIAAADEWVGKALAAKRAELNSAPSAAPASLDVNAPPPPLPASAPPPPPPPPAPPGYKRGEPAK